MELVLLNILSNSCYSWEVKIAFFDKALVTALACAGLQMCCNVGGVSFFFFCGGRKKQNKFPSNLHCPVKKLNPFLF